MVAEGFGVVFAACHEAPRPKNGLDGEFLGDLFPLHFQAPIKNETLLLTENPRPFIGDLLLVLGLGERLVLLDFQD